MDSNQEQKDLTQYATKCASVMGNIFESVDKWHSTNNENEKNQQLEKLRDYITNFEILLDRCYIDVNESIGQIAKGKFEKRSNNPNENSALLNEEPIPEETLVRNIVDRLSKFNLKV